MKIMKTTLLTSAIFAASLVNAATTEVRTMPAGDGNLIDTNGDKIADEAASTVLNSKSVMEVNSGHIWKQTRKAIFEFKLPKEVPDVKKATLVLNVNGKYGTHPDKPGAGPECDLWYYTGENANGAVELADDAVGKKVGKLIEKGAAVGKSRQVKVDVTVAVNEAMEKKSVFIGFRIQKSETKSPDGVWRWRTSEFGQKYGKKLTPTLILISK